MDKNKWTKGSDTEGRTLVLELPMNLVRKTSKKSGKVHSSLAQIGSNYGGVCVGQNHEGKQVMLRCDVYLKDPTVAVNTNSSFSVG